MCVMSESSLPNFGRIGLRLLSITRWPTRLKGRLGSFYARVRGAHGGAEPARAPELESLAELAVREYIGSHAGLLERAARLAEKAERLERDDTPSESARNRAERACGEVVAGLAALRASFVDTARGRDGASAAFDRVVESLCPAFAPPLPSDGLG